MSCDECCICKNYDVQQTFYVRKPFAEGVAIVRKSICDWCNSEYQAVFFDIPEPSKRRLQQWEMTEWMDEMKKQNKEREPVAEITQWPLETSGYLPPVISEHERKEAFEQLLRLKGLFP